MKYILPPSFKTFPAILCDLILIHHMLSVHIVMWKKEFQEDGCRNGVEFCTKF